MTRWAARIFLPLDVALLADWFDAQLRGRR